MMIHGKYVCFWGGWLSNFAWAPMKALCLDGITRTFFSSEQYFMWHKAWYFKDFEILNEIENLPFNDDYSYEAKKLGRNVKNFNQDEWFKVADDVMYMGCLAKFSQNKVLFDLITSPEYDDKYFVEASPYDCIWGVGLGEADELIADENNWRGKNLLGKVLDRVRLELLNGYKDVIDY